MPFRTQLKTGCEGEWSAFDPLPKLTQASDKDVRIIVGKERESYEPKLNSKDTSPSAQKWTVGLEHRKGLGTSRADVSGNARHFCEVEFNSKDTSPSAQKWHILKTMKNELTL